MPINLLYRESSSETPPSSIRVKDAPLTSLEVDANFKSVSDTTDALNANKAPNDHSSAQTTYGVGTNALFGHLKVVDTGTDPASSSIAASPKLVSDSVDNYKTEFEGILDDLINEYSA